MPEAKVENTSYGLPAAPVQVMGTLQKSLSALPTSAMSLSDCSGRWCHMFTVAMDWPPVSRQTVQHLAAHAVSPLNYGCITSVLYQLFSASAWHGYYTVRWAATWGFPHDLPVTNTWYTTIWLRYWTRLKKRPIWREYHDLYPKTTHVSIRPRPTPSERCPDPAHAALRLAVNTHSGRKRQTAARPRGRPRKARVQQTEVGSGLSADAAWNMTNDRCR